ncbi:hypothetical protein, partial [Parachlamydia acanthamoebae]
EDDISKTLRELKKISDTENGGCLSYTMKSVDSHSGGIACGRRLSQRVNDALNVNPSLKVHKYGGSFKVRKEDFEEYQKEKKKL